MNPKSNFLPLNGVSFEETTPLSTVVRNFRAVLGQLFPPPTGGGGPGWGHPVAVPDL